MKSSIRAVAGVLIVVTVSGVAFAQARSQEPARTVQISGRILDPTGAVLPRARVRLVVPDGGEVVGDITTDPRGRYEFSTVPPNRYGILIEARGFTPQWKRIRQKWGDPDWIVAAYHLKNRSHTVSQSWASSSRLVYGHIRSHSKRHIHRMVT